MLENLSVRLLAHQRPARSSPVTESEFWICFGKWLNQQVMRSEKGSILAQTEKEAAGAALEGKVTQDCFEVILAFKLDEFAGDLARFRIQASYPNQSA
jgi:hypothetical protein